MAKTNKITIKRIYEEVGTDDGYRILVDRLWPRGVSKINAHLNEWNKTIAPSVELRKWFDHKPERSEVFMRRYEDELSQNKTELQRIKTIAAKQHVTLLYGAKNPLVNHASVLCKVLSQL